MKTVRHFFSWKNGYAGFILLGLTCLIYLLTNFINHRFWLLDFEVYYKAAGRILEAKNLYAIPEDGHFIFKYSPVSAVYFIPFAFFSFSTAKIIYWIFLSGIIVYSFYLCIRLFAPQLLQDEKWGKINTLVLIVTATLAIHYLRELDLGQVNYLLFFLFLLSLLLLKKNKWMLFALVLAISLYIKPYALIFIPYLLLKKRYRETAFFILSVAILSLLPILFYRSFDFTVAQYQAWFTELKIELGNKQDLLAPHNHTLFSVIARYTPFRFIAENKIATLIYQGIMLAAIAFLTWIFVSRKNNKPIEIPTQENLSLDFAWLVALIPLLASTSENAFVFEQMALFVVLINFKSFKPFGKTVLIIALILIGMNFGEAWGETISHFMNDQSLITVGTLFLLSLFFIMRKKNGKWDN